MILVFLFAVVAGLPWLSALSFNNLKKAEEEIGEILLEKNALYIQTILLQLLLFGMAYFAMKSESFNIEWIGSLNIYAIMASIGLIAGGLFTSYLSQRNKKQSAEQNTLQYLLPNNAKERLFWIFACVFAAVCEEFVYRGVLFQVLLGYTDYWIITAILCSIVFAFGHGTQGENAILTIIPFAMGFHVIVYLSKGLLLAIIAHFIYNILVDIIFGKSIKNASKS